MPKSNGLLGPLFELQLVFAWDLEVCLLSFFFVVAIIVAVVIPVERSLHLDIPTHLVGHSTTACTAYLFFNLRSYF